MQIGQAIYTTTQSKRGLGIWLEQTNTDCLVAEELVEAVVPREDIVLTIHPPYIRPHTGFASE